MYTSLFTSAIKPKRNKGQMSKAQVLLLLFLFFRITVIAQENSLIEISGNVLDLETRHPLESVSVQVKVTVAGTITNAKGNFRIYEFVSTVTCR